MDMVPGLFYGVDMSETTASMRLIGIFMNVRFLLAMRLRLTVVHLFFHFSGFDPNKPWTVSKYQNRFDMSTIGDTRKLYSHYHESAY